MVWNFKLFYFHTTATSEIRIFLTTAFLEMRGILKRTLSAKLTSTRETSLSTLLTDLQKNFVITKENTWRNSLIRYQTYTYSADDANSKIGKVVRFLDEPSADCAPLCAPDLTASTLLMAE